MNTEMSATTVFDTCVFSSSLLFLFFFLYFFFGGCPLKNKGLPASPFPARLGLKMGRSSAKICGVPPACLDRPNVLAARGLNGAEGYPSNVAAPNAAANGPRGKGQGKVFDGEFYQREGDPSDESAKGGEGDGGDVDRCLMAFQPADERSDLDKKADSVVAAAYIPGRPLSPEALKRPYLHTFNVMPYSSSSATVSPPPVGLHMELRDLDFIWCPCKVIQVFLEEGVTMVKLR